MILTNKKSNYLMSNQKILFSGIQPTGEIHLGNYLGALKNWVTFQDGDKYNCFYSIVDLHAITIDYDPQKFQEQILNSAMDLIAIGIDPKKSCLFVQSQVPEHTELCWLLNTLTPISELERMTQFKDKANQHKQNINAGLFDYPVLQAADILLYRGEYVPVGQDQLQHLELTNTILRKFNNKYGEYFKEIKPIIGQGARIMSLIDPTKKMSKSLGSVHYISLNDDTETIKKKISKAVTDAGDGNAMSAGVKNLFTLLELMADKKTFQKYQKAFNNNSLKYSELKDELANAIITLLKPIQEKKKKLNKKQVQKILNDGAKHARRIAQKNILEIKKRMGMAIFYINKKTIKNSTAYDKRKWNLNPNNKQYTKAEYQASNPDAYDKCCWNLNPNNEQYTKAEHQASNPDAYEKLWWNLNMNNEPYSKAEHQASNPDAYEKLCWNDGSNNEQYTEKEIKKGTD